MPTGSSKAIFFFDTGNILLPSPLIRRQFQCFHFMKNHNVIIRHTEIPMLLYLLVEVPFVLAPLIDPYLQTRGDVAIPLLS